MTLEKHYFFLLCITFVYQVRTCFTVVLHKILEINDIVIAKTIVVVEIGGTV